MFLPAARSRATLLRRPRPNNMAGARNGVVWWCGPARYQQDGCGKHETDSTTAAAFPFEPDAQGDRASPAASAVASRARGREADQ